ncbi:MAG: hypothetical protein E7536_06035 [Ruminococcaceae bacterium]|nr:hypothetical protein [Oscillospiraceae bacterium]
MKKCNFCGKENLDNTKFCTSCGKPFVQKPSPAVMESRAVQSVKFVPATPPAPKKKKSSKGIIIAIVAVLLVAAVVLGIIFMPGLFDKKTSEEEKLKQLLEESTTKPIVEFVCDDYDSDGTYEAYAIVGKTDESDEEHPEFYDADIYFVNQKKAQPIKENISGKVNGKIKLDKIIYISIEIYEGGKGKSFIYTAKGKKPVEAKNSGKYSDVHEENGKVVGTNENGKETEIDISGKKTSEAETEYLMTKMTVYNADDSVDMIYEYEYDSEGNMIKETIVSDEYESCTEYEYDENGNVKKSSDYENEYFVEYEYDSNGNLVEERIYDCEYEYLNVYEYDSYNNITKSTEYEYDGDVFTFEAEYEYNADDKPIRVMIYDEDANKSSMYEIEYNSNGEVIKETDYDFDDTVRSVTEYEYDEKGNMTKEVTDYNETYEEYSETIKYEYDADSNLVKEVEYNYVDDIVRVTEYEFDTNGNMTKKTEENYEDNIGYYIEYEYEAK